MLSTYVMKLCNPNDFKIFKILATLTVSSAISERTFSTLEIIKTYLRNSTSKVRII